MGLNLSNQYDHRALMRYLLMVLGTVFAMRLTKGYAAAAIVLPVMAAVFGRRPVSVIFWVLFLTMAAVGNPSVWGRRDIAVLTTRGILLIMTVLVAGRAFASRSSRSMKPIWGILAYIGWECISSAQGYAPIVSYLKLFLFCCIFFALFGVANEVNMSSRVNARELRSAILAIVAFMILGSVALIPFPGISQMTGEAAVEAMKNGAVSLFCGVCAHSQAMGPVAGVVATFVLADLVFSVKKWDPFYLVLLVSCPLICYKSSSRTGMGTMIAGMGMVMYFFLKSRGVGSKWKQRVMSSAMMVMILMGFAIVVLPQTREKMTQFVLKSTASGGKVTSERVLSSRQALIDESKRGFRNKPIFGNGFQVSAAMQERRRGSWKSYLSAPIEKGVWFYAIPEEGGLVGMILFCGWLIWMFPTLIKRHAHVMAGTMFAFVMANTGEFCFFSMSYIGGFYWALVFAAGALDVQRMKGQHIRVFDVSMEQIREEVAMDEWARVRG